MQKLIKLDEICIQTKFLTEQNLGIVLYQIFEDEFVHNKVVPNSGVKYRKK